MFGNRDRADRDSLIRSYDEEEMYGLDDLAEESEDDAPLNGRRVNEKMNGKARVNGMGKLKIDSNRRASGLRSPGAGSRGGSRSPSGSGGRSPRSPRPL